MSSKFVPGMQGTSGTSSTVTVQGGTVIQVSPKVSSSSHTIFQQNGQLIVGKIVSVDPSTSESHSGETITLQNSGQTVPSNYPIQYIEAAPEQTVYAATGNNGQIEYIEINSGKPVTKIIAPTKSESGQYQDYNPSIYSASMAGGATYYQSGGQLHVAGGAGGSSATTLQGLHGRAQLVTHQGNTYLVQDTQLEQEGSPMPHTTRASPVTVQWLIDNYETAEGVSLPRSTLYNHYMRHCHEQKIEPMNPASFGKLIRSVFLGLRTRRLGTRGNSKYHYYGIRIKPNSHLNQFVEDHTFAMRHYPHYHKQNMEADFQNPRFKPITKYEAGMSVADMRSAGMGGSGGGGPSGAMGGVGPAVGAGSSGPGEDPNQHHQFLGSAGSALPNLGEICVSAGLGGGVMGAAEPQQIGVKLSLPAGVVEDDVGIFTKLYAEHCEEILNAVVNLSFSMLESIWQTFWRTGGTEDPELERRLPRQKLSLLLQNENIQKFVRISDHSFYQSLVEVLCPEVLRPIPSTLTQGIRNFAKSLEGWMRSATRGLDPDIAKIKLGAVAALAQTLRRYTSLNHLAQAARAVLQNTNQITQMLTDLNRVDFTNVQEQASWVCHCDDSTVTQLEQDFKKILQQQTSLEQWATWLDQVVSSVLRKHENRPDFPKAARQFILKWSFYSSMVIRDLTLRSAASFGSFHLIRLLYDEYIYYLVEHKVAAHEGMTPVAVMGELGKSVDSDDVSEAGREASFESVHDESTVSSVATGAYGYGVEEAGGLDDQDQNQKEGEKTYQNTVKAMLPPPDILVKGSPGTGPPVQEDAANANSSEGHMLHNGSPPPITSTYNLYTRKTVRVTTGDAMEPPASSSTIQGTTSTPTTSTDTAPPAAKRQRID